MNEKLTDLKSLYVHELKDLYNAEHQLTQALPKMAEAAGDPKLKECFQGHLKETEGHVQRLEQVFKDLDEKPGGVHCDGMEGLLKEGEDILGQKGSADAATFDAGLITAAQRVEHYEMAGYGSVRNYAQRLGFDEAANLLQQTLDEEGKADHLLTDIAKQINPAAPAG